MIYESDSHLVGFVSIMKDFGTFSFEKAIISSQNNCITSKLFIYNLPLFKFRPDFIFLSPFLVQLTYILQSDLTNNIYTRKNT